MPTVLVIDDETTILENIRFNLEMENYNVITASNGEDGLNIFREKINIIDAVITDMRMPKLTGIDVLREVKKLMPEMGVLILTGHGDIENAIQTMKEGAFEYLKKPLNVDQLSIIISKAIEKKNLLLENTNIQKKLLDQNSYLQGLHDSAEKILLNLLPKKLPEMDNVRFSVEYKSSEAVGGDMYDICDIGDYLCFYVFDVSNHGILAAVIAVILKSFLQNIEYNYRQGINKRRFPEIVADLNNEVLINTAENVFATLFLGFLDKKTNVLYYVSAGHVTQYLFNNEKIEPLNSTGTVLGAFEDATYTCSVHQLSPGDKVVLFSDGILEVSNDDIIFGYKNIEKNLMENNSKPIDVITKELLKASAQYGSNDFFDDVTIVGMELIK
ncbi:response regulator [Pseudobacteroides cellulosolvens]|uniref:Stage 0 sporulation protein A homolog n=1 Tax=Pseudobacteroides cellulosolvens ATCC 35603 = DSM 2933 TaxID=398512 RepID=A0A0L6JLV3_9FIRM|nr:response regulator [Pseudobacteroides cellulosolvens]KNY26801.1 response regulator receiver protein [Pseudobacteroides cellulosolvens ATCC 35603 = DSM 2933]